MEFNRSRRRIVSVGSVQDNGAICHVRMDGRTYGNRSTIGETGKEERAVINQPVRAEVQQ
jgi:hypothetical protein